MAEVYNKFFTGKLNTDLSPEVMPKEDWVDALNVDILEDGEKGRVIRMRGNELVNNPDLPAGINTVIGVHSYDPLGRIYYWVHNSNESHQLWEFDVETITFTLLIQDNLPPKFLGSILKLSLDHRVNHANMIVGAETDEEGEPERQYLTWTDGFNPPRGVNVWRLKNDPEWISNGINEDVITLYKAAPIKGISADYMHDTTQGDNRLTGKAWRFRYRYVYKDGERSAWSSISKIPIPTAGFPNIIGRFGLDNLFYINFYIENGLYIDKVEIATQYTIKGTNEFSDWYLINTYDDIDGLNDSFVWRYVPFYGSEQFIPIPVEESNLLFDDIPLIAQSQEVIDGNVLAYGNITQDYDIPQPEETGSPTFSFTVNSKEIEIQGILAHVKLDSFTHRVYVRCGQDYLDNVVETKGSIFIELTNHTQPFPFDPADYYIRHNYAFSPGNTAQNIVDFFASILSGTTGVENGLSYVEFSYPQGDVTRVGSGNFVLFSNSDASIVVEGVAKLWDDYYTGDVGIAYHDKFGRITSVIKQATELPVKNDSPNYFPYTDGDTHRLNLQISHQPPEWAHSYQIVRTKNKTMSDFLTWYGVVSAVTNERGGVTTLILPRADFDQNFPSNTVDFIPQKGDRILFIGNSVDGNEEELAPRNITHFTIGSYDPETFTLVVQGIDPRLAVNEIWRMRIYRPAEPSDIYYEFGEVYPIIGPGENGRHYGNVYSQSSDYTTPAIVTTQGDIWSHIRVSYSDTGVFFSTGMRESPDVSDFFLSNVNDDGRPNAVDTDYKRRTLPTTIVHSTRFNIDSELNDISRFYPTSRFDYRLSKGGIKVLAERGNYLIAFQELGVCSIPVNTNVISDVAGNDQLALSDTVLNQARYYSGEYGIGDKPASFVRSNNYFYFLDPNKGEWCRLASDGINPLSEQLETSLYFNRKSREYYNEGDKVISVYDADSKSIYIHFTEIEGLVSPDAIGFKEGVGFTSRNTLFYEDGVSLGDIFYTFKGSQMYQKNTDLAGYNYFGEPQISEIQFYINENPGLIKTWLSIAEDAKLTWEPVEIQTKGDQLSSLKQSDFIIYEGGGIEIDNKEGIYYSNFLRDENSTGGLLQGDKLKGSWLKVKLQDSGQEENHLFGVYIKANHSPHGIW